MSEDEQPSTTPGSVTDEANPPRMRNTMAILQAVTQNLEEAAEDAPATGSVAATPATPAPQAARTAASADLPGPQIREADRKRPMIWLDREVWDDMWVRMSLLVVVALLYFVGLGSFGLWDPWEVHYGAVGWGHIERHDWISPWWGSYWEAPGKRMEGDWFFSKPILLLWMMGMGMQAFGFGELGIRFGTTLTALLGVMAVYMAGSRIWSRRTGVLMALVLTTSPFYAMLSRQAQTDMPFVSLMTVALAFFMMGAFGRDRHRKADKASWWMFGLFLAAVVIPQLETITVGQLRWRQDLSIIEAIFTYGPTQLAIYLGVFAIFLVTQLRQSSTTRGQLYFYVFYVFIGLATMAKGLLGFGLPGAIILFYLIITREWGLLRRVELLRGIMLTVLAGFPWYGAMLARHGGIGGSWWTRFIIHDHFKRLATGVHQIDTGSFEHFIRWLGYGLFPWGSLVPAVIAQNLSARDPDKSNKRSDTERARLFLFLWAAIAFALFTMSSTKFHHYIFPVVPAVALLVALLLDDLLAGKIDFGRWWPLYLVSIGLFALVGFDLSVEPQHLKNLFTYAYDRDWDHDAWDAGFKKALLFWTLVNAVGMLALAHSERRWLLRFGVGVLVAGSLGLSGWALHVYMPGISSTWSQKGLWDTYYSLCTPADPPPQAHAMKAGRYCSDSVISYKLNWRGETFYTMNEIIPIRDNDEWDFFVEDNAGHCFYAIMDRGQRNGFESKLPAAQRATVRSVHEGNLKFILLAVNCDLEDDELATEPTPEEEAATDDAEEEASGERNGEDQPPAEGSGTP